MLSRLPRPVTHSLELDEFAKNFSLSIQEALLDAELIARETKKDAILSKVLSYTLNGWPPSSYAEDGRRTESVLEQKRRDFR